MPDDEPSQETLFDIEPDWKAEWQNMPECVGEDLLPWKRLIVKFATKADYERFCELIGAELTDRAKGTWYPPIGTPTFLHMRYAQVEDWDDE